MYQSDLVSRMIGCLRRIYASPGLLLNLKKKTLKLTLKLTLILLVSLTLTQTPTNFENYLFIEIKIASFLMHDFLRGDPIVSPCLLLFSSMPNISKLLTTI